MAIAIDASTPAAVNSTGTGTLTTASFSPPAGSLLLANVVFGSGAVPTISQAPADKNSASNSVSSASLSVSANDVIVVTVLINGTGASGSSISASVSDTKGLTWTARKTLVYAGSTANGYAGIFTATAGSGGTTTITATASGSQDAGNEILINIRTFTNAHEAGGASASKTASAGQTSLSTTLTPNSSNSFIIWVAGDESALNTLTPASNNAAIGNGDTGSIASSQFEYYMGKYTGAVTAGTGITVGASGSAGDSMGMVAYEIQPASPSTAVSDTGGATWTAGPSDSNNGLGLAAQFYTYYATAPGAITVSATQVSQKSGDSHLLEVFVLTGAKQSQTGAATVGNRATGTNSSQQSITTTTTGSLVFCCGADDLETVQGSPSLTLNANTTEQASGTGTQNAKVYYSTNQTGTPGAKSLGYTGNGSGDSWVFAMQEILPAPPTAIAGLFLPSPTWLNRFGPLSHNHDLRVPYDYRIQASGSYVSAGDIAFSANTSGLSLIPVNDPQQSLFSPAWLNVFQPYVAKSAVLFDTQPPTFFGTYLTSGDLAFGATTTGLAVAGSTGPATALPGPSWINQFQQDRSEKFAILFDQYPQATGATTLVLAFGALTTGLVSIPGLTSAPISAPGPAWLNRFGQLSLAKFPVYYDGVTLPPPPLQLTCVGGSVIDLTQPFGGTALDINTYAGTTSDENLYGGAVVGRCQPQQVNLALSEFNDEVIDLTVLNNGNAFNLSSSYSLRAIFKQQAGNLDSSPSTLTLSTQSGAITIVQPSSLGQAVLTIPKADLQNTNFRFWRLDVVNSLGQVATVSFGTVSIRAL